MRSRVANVIVVAALLACPLVADAAETLVRQFESLGRYGEPTPLAINKAGLVVGKSMTRAVRYNVAASPQGPVQPYGGRVPDNYKGDLPLFQHRWAFLHQQTRVANAINASGQVVGQGGMPVVRVDEPRGGGGRVAASADRAFLWSDTPDGKGEYVDLGTLGGNSAVATGINDAGQIVGRADLPDRRIHAFLYAGKPGAGGAIFDLGTLPGQPFSVAASINATGQVAGTSGSGIGLEGHAFRYDGVPGKDGKMHDLGVLPGYDDSTGRAINDAGIVVGFCVRRPSSDRAFAYVGTPGKGGRMIDLGSLDPDPRGASRACGIDSAGRIVGYSNVADDPVQPRAFVYAGLPGKAWRMIDLDAWLDAVSPAEGKRWTLNVANAISDAGLIVGEGTMWEGTMPLSRVAFVLDASALLKDPDAAVAAIAAMPPAAKPSRQPAARPTRQAPPVTR